MFIFGAWIWYGEFVIEDMRRELQRSDVSVGCAQYYTFNTIHLYEFRFSKRIFLQALTTSLERNISVCIIASQCIFVFQA